MQSPKILREFSPTGFGVMLIVALLTSAGTGLLHAGPFGGVLFVLTVGFAGMMLWQIVLVARLIDDFENERTASRSERVRVKGEMHRQGVAVRAQSERSVEMAETLGKVTATLGNTKVATQQMLIRSQTPDMPAWISIALRSQDTNREAILVGQLALNKTIVPQFAASLLVGSEENDRQGDLYFQACIDHAVSAADKTMTKAVLKLFTQARQESTSLRRAFIQMIFKDWTGIDKATQKTCLGEMKKSFPEASTLLGIGNEEQGT